jgi:hypothetical protein
MRVQVPLGVLTPPGSRRRRRGRRPAERSARLAQRQSGCATCSWPGVRVPDCALRTNRKAEEPGCEPGRCGFESRRPPRVGGTAATAPGCKPGIPHAGSSPARPTYCPAHLLPGRFLPARLVARTHSPVSEWSGAGLQIWLRRFESGRGFLWLVAQRIVRRPPKSTIAGSSPAQPTGSRVVGAMDSAAVF